MNLPFAVPDILLFLCAVNALTVALFWLDKRRARNDGWRIPEYMLLLLSLLGGSPAAFWAMRTFRHKTRKGSFRIRYWLTVALQMAALVYIMSL